ncbi:hypothetical protein ONZ45_g15873 [Pleurotus djamor]|nr:hypothetical protein ONZ45_g15873 [Pleurotus djamor]
MVITALSRSADRRILYPLLAVSHQFHQLVIPFLYESITLPPVLSAYDHYMDRFTPTTTISSQSKFDKFLATISRHQTLASHVITFINYEYGKSSIADWISIKQALARFSRLKRLLVLPHSAIEGFDLARILPRPVSLTHLVFQYLWTEDVYELIRAQPSLEYISLGHAEQTVSLSTLPPAMLPNLTSLTCDGCFLSKLGESPPIKDLYLRCTSGFTPRAVMVLEILRNVRYLSLPIDIFESIAGNCERVEFLWINSCDDIDNGFLARMPSRTLKYLRLKPAMMEINGIELPWEVFPDLTVIDIDCHIFGDTTRIGRGTCQEDGRRIRIPQVEEFEHWHEVCMDSFEVPLERKGDPEGEYFEVEMGAPPDDEFRVTFPLGRHIGH